ncbi:WD40-repeat-containing domain protein [Chiua virens]|nr:WD40-repeat-containing domain protein [Chiua virens]
MSTTNLNERAAAALTEINAGSQPIRALAFTTNGEYLVSGDKEGVRVWRMSDNQQLGATLKARDVRCVAVSSDRRCIAAGKSWGEITVWDPHTPKEVFTQNEDGHTVTGVDFSPDSTRLVSASGSRAVSVWDVTTGERVVGPLHHTYWVVAAKFSPRGDKIATATYLRDLIRIYDVNGHKLFEFSGKVTPYYNTGLLWSNRDESIFILSNNVVQQIDVSSTQTKVVSQWSITESNFPSIVSPKFGDFIAFSSSCTVTRCDMSTSNQLPSHSALSGRTLHRNLIRRPGSRGRAVGMGRSSSKPYNP